MQIKNDLMTNDLMTNNMGIYGWFQKKFLLRHAPRSLRFANHMGKYGCFQKTIHHQPPPCHFDRREKTLQTMLPLPFMRRSFLSRASFEMT